MQPPLRIQIIGPDDESALNAVRMLWREYAEYLLALLGPEHVSLDNYCEELQRLPAEYAAPGGALTLAIAENLPAGCAGIRKIVTTQGVPAFELRRLWVSPRFRRVGAARALLTAASDWVKNVGGSELYLDCVAHKMPAAVLLYRAAGFQACDRYNKNSIPGIAFFRKTVV